MQSAQGQQQQQQQQVPDVPGQAGGAAAAAGGGGGGGGGLLAMPNRLINRAFGGMDGGDTAGAELVSFRGVKERFAVSRPLEQALYTQFDGSLLQPTQLPARIAAHRSRRLPQETFGLAADSLPSLNRHSIAKLEQRLAKAVRLNPVDIATGAVPPVMPPLALPPPQQMQMQAAVPMVAPDGRLLAPALPGGGGGGAVFDPTQGGVLRPQPGLPLPSAFLSEAGLMVNLPDPVKAVKERSSRRFDQDMPRCDAEFCLPTVSHVAMSSGSGGAAVGPSGRTYRLDLELGRLEFGVHPCMGREDLLAAGLVAVFREFKRRQAVNLVASYGSKLAALEDALLAYRERMFQLQEAGAAGEQVADVLARCGALEREVAEVRQLKEEEQLVMLQMVEQMDVLWQQIGLTRSQQGGARTALSFSLGQLPPEEDDLDVEPGSISRPQLDALLLAAEAEEIAGLPPPPEGFSAMLPPDATNNGSFKLRRIEATCAAHAAVTSALRARIDQMRGRPSHDPAELERLVLELDQMGAAPRRLQLPPQQYAALRAQCEARVAAGDAGVMRPPRFEPMLSLGGATMTGTGTAGGAAAGGGGGRAASSRYYVRLMINNRVVDISQPVVLRDDFTADFRDVFSVRLQRWPDTIQLQLYERGLVKDTLLSTIFVVPPGLGGTPHVDAQPRSYGWASQTPFRQRISPSELALIDAAAQQAQAQGQQLPAALADAGRSLTYPAGTLFVRCGWVADESAASAAASAALASATMYNNPLADMAGGAAAGAGEAEALTRSVMPPIPHMAVDRAMRQVAAGGGLAGPSALAKGMGMRQQIGRILAQTLLDPNDPRNAPLIELMQVQEAQQAGPSDRFRLDVLTDVALRGSRSVEKRIEFLQKRWQAGAFRANEVSVLKGPRGMRVPVILSARDAEDLEHLYMGALTAVGAAGPGRPAARLGGEVRAAQFTAVLAKEIEAREARIREFALQVRSAAARVAGGLTSSSGKRYTTPDVVQDVPLPNFNINLSAIFRLLEERRPLRGQKKVVRAIVSSPPQNTKLMVTIQRATNLPVRLDGSPGAGFSAAGSLTAPAATAADGGSSGASSLNVFVEVRFRSGVDRTRAIAGETNPLFNHQMELDVFDAEADPTPSTLYESGDLVTINVFDEIVGDSILAGRQQAARAAGGRAGDDNSGADQVRYAERERRYLGSFSFPLSSLYQLQVLQGVFRLNTPPVLLGYKQDSERPPCVSIYASFKPRLAPPAPEAPEELRTGEEEEIASHAARWVSTVMSMPQARGRAVKAMVVDSEGTAHLICRYLGPTAMPPLPPSKQPPVGDEAAMLHAARFVAHIPFMEDNQLQKSRYDIYTTSAVFLAMSCGDGEEHAHLLAGYFLGLGHQAFVVMGTSTSGGRSSFVLTTGNRVDPATLGGGAGLEAFSEVRQGGSRTFQRGGAKLAFGSALDPLKARLWNPLTGGCCAVRDATGEMREVGMVYDGANAWANVQAVAAPWDMNWDLGNGSAWRPFFGPLLAPRAVMTVQAPPAYFELPPRFYEELEGRVEEAVRDVIYRARPRQVTQPHNSVSRALKGLLQEIPAALDAIAVANLGAAGVVGEQEYGVEGSARLAERKARISELQARHNTRVAAEARTPVMGHILALPYSDKYEEAIAQAVLNTGIHRNSSDRARYAMAAYVEPLGHAFVCCIWIYVAVTKD